MGSLTDALSAHTRVGLDTAAFIYHLEQHPRYAALTQALFKGIEQGHWIACTSTVTLMELSVRPWQLHQPHVARHYEAVLTRFPNLALVDVHRGVAQQAARLRALYRLRPADALQAATALSWGATAFITNDRGLVRLASELTVVLLEDWIPAE